MNTELRSTQKRAAAFISERDPFGDHFSARDLALLDPLGGYTEETYVSEQARLHGPDLNRER